MRRLLVVTLLLVTTACGSSDDEPAAPADATPTTVRVLAAASLTEAFGVLIEAFEEVNEGVDVQVSFGGSPALVTQVAEGAPADVLATADEASMGRAVDAGDVARPAVFARNRLTVVVEPGNPLGITAVRDLARDDVLLVACAAAVPCGALATRVLEAAAVTVTPRSLEENVKAVLAKVTLGEADAGLVYETDARAAGTDVESLSILPSEPSLTTSYPIAVTTATEARRASGAFVAFVRSVAGQRVLADHGFLPAG